MTLDRIEVEANPCPVCRGDRVTCNATFGYWMCQDCGDIWGHEKDDPDFEEAQIPSLGDRLTAHIEAGMTLHELRQEREGDRNDNH